MDGETSHRDRVRPDRIGPYRVFDRVGGGVGVVHRAADPSGRDVAIRMPPPGPYDVPRMRQVHSPYVVDVLDGDPAADPPYIVSRFVPGRPLDEWLPGPLRGGALRRMALGLARALAAVHEAGLVHGDLRPGTILVVDGSPVVIDFALVPGGVAGDLRAWAGNVAFAATGDPRSLTDPAASVETVPEALRPLLEAAAGPGAPSAADLAAAVTDLDLGTEPAPRPAPEPPPHPRPSPEPAPGAEPPAGAGPAPGAGPAVGSGTAAGDRSPAGVGRVERSWARLLAALLVVLAVGVAIAMPVAGTLLSVAVAFVLRGRASGWGKGLAWTALSVPYAALVGAAVTVVLVGMSAFKVDVDPLGACAFGAGAAVAALWAAPGLGGPRRDVQERLVAALPSPRRLALAAVLLGLLALAVVVAAISVTPSFAPLYGLQTSLEGTIGRWQASLR